AHRHRELLPLGADRIEPFGQELLLLVELRPAGVVGAAGEGWVVTAVLRDRACASTPVGGAWTGSAVGVAGWARTNAFARAREHYEWGSS
ncbi:hypothetical protein ACIBL5_37915, partial [Streptomyces sp. NPDC050516]|uniref:hypothetical protein n=1 Tax=Streptomyces sp. NPDC050516 TaxID=3365621 RepID=UPI00378D2468